MADRFRKRMAGNVRPDNRAPVLLQRKFNHAAVKSLSLDQSGDDVGKRYHYTRPPLHPPTPGAPRRAPSRWARPDSAFAPGPRPPWVGRN